MIYTDRDIPLDEVYLAERREVVETSLGEVGMYWMSCPFNWVFVQPVGRPIHDINAWVARPVLEGFDDIVLPIRGD